jgi:hypothetical protein
MERAHAPVPFTPAERILFAQLYETLVHVSCEGRVEGVLAESWTVSEDSLEWTFTLRADSVDSSGLPVITRDWNGFGVSPLMVGGSWARADIITAGEGRPPTSMAGARVIYAEPFGVARVRVRTSEPVLLSWFARPEMAVARHSTSDPGWPEGTGPVRPTDLSASGADSTRSLSAIALQGSVPLEARVVTGDPRSALEVGADILVTNDPQVIDYANAAPAFTTVPFAWDRSWVLLTPAGMPSSGDSGVVRVPGSLGSPIPSWQMRVIRPPEGLRNSWARDAVPVETRPSYLDGPEQPPCNRVPTMQSLPGTPGRAAVGRSRRIVYRVGDDVARALAERLVALAPRAAWLGTMLPDLGGAGPLPTAVGLAPAGFAAAVREGRDAGYVVAAERSLAMSACESLASLALWAPWLALPADADALTPSPAAMLLVDTRSTLVLRRGIVGAAVDGSGVLRLGRVRRVQPEPRP